MDLHGLPYKGTLFTFVLHKNWPFLSLTLIPVIQFWYRQADTQVHAARQKEARHLFT
jgi:hypothetical protein